jgi:trehalose utilization protein
MDRLKVLSWSELTEPAGVYPAGIHAAVCEALREHSDVDCRLADITMPEQGLSEESLAWADVVVWFSHVHGSEIHDDLVARIVSHVTEQGMGFVALHSSLISTVFAALMGTTGWHSGWRDDATTEHIHFTAPEHPIAEGMKDFDIPQTEIFFEPFDIPEPEEVVFEGRWDTGEWFRSGCCFTIGKGRVFYFRPGHETYPIFFQPEVRRLLTNCVEWAGKRR